MNANDSHSRSPLRSKPLIYSAIAIVLVTVLIIVLFPRKANQSTTAYYTATRGDFLISVVEGGNLEAVREVTIRSEVEGTARVISIVPEGTYVKKGDLLVQLDSGSAEDQKNQQEIAVRKAELAVTTAEEQVKIGVSQTNSDITAAVINEQLAKLNLDKYTEGALAQTRRELGMDVVTKKEALVLAEDTYRYSTNLLANEFETKSKADQDRLAWMRATDAWVSATNQLWMFETFDKEVSLKEFQSKLEEAEKQLDRVKSESRAKMAQDQADLLTQQRTLELNLAKLARDEKNLAACTIRAPSDGLVVYPMAEGRFSSESMIEEGATVRYRQSLITLPDISSMKLTVKIHESHVGNVKPGLAAYVVLDPMPDKRFMGTVSKVGLLPDSQSRWSNPNLKVYSTEIMITDPLPENLKPGVSARAEILITQLKDVISVPIQAVTTLKGKPVVYLVGAKPTPVPVQVGLFNTKRIEVVSGVKEGDRILLAPPLDSGEGTIDGSVIQDDLDIEVTNQVDVAKSSALPGATAGTLPGTVENGRQNSGQPAPGGAPSGGQGRGGFDREAMTKKYDKDGDGTLNEEERTAMRAEMQDAMMKRMDTDGDGTVSEEERAAAAAQFGGGSRGGGGGGGGNRQRGGAPGGDGPSN